MAQVEIVNSGLRPKENSRDPSGAGHVISEIKAVNEKMITTSSAAGV